MQLLKKQGYGGVIIWSLDLDDKSGAFCNEGPFPLINAAKRELLVLPDQLPATIEHCYEDNGTLLIEGLPSASTTISMANFSKLEESHVSSLHFDSIFF